MHILLRLLISGSFKYGENFHLLSRVVSPDLIRKSGIRGKEAVKQLHIKFRPLDIVNSTNMDKPLKQELEFIPLPPSPNSINMDKPLNQDLEFIPLPPSPAQDNSDLPSKIVRPQEPSIKNECFKLDSTPSDIKLDLSYLTLSKDNATKDRHACTSVFIANQQQSKDYKLPCHSKSATQSKISLSCSIPEVITLDDDGNNTIIPSKSSQSGDFLGFRINPEEKQEKSTIAGVSSRVYGHWKCENCKICEKHKSHSTSKGKKSEKFKHKNYVKCKCRRCKICKDKYIAFKSLPKHNHRRYYNRPEMARLINHDRSVVSRSQSCSDKAKIRKAKHPKMSVTIPELVILSDDDEEDIIVIHENCKPILTQSTETVVHEDSDSFLNTRGEDNLTLLDNHSEEDDEVEEGESSNDEASKAEERVTTEDYTSAVFHPPSDADDDEVEEGEIPSDEAIEVENQEFIMKDNYECIGMETDSERSLDDYVDDIIETKDSDYVPLKNVRLSDIQYDVDISDEVKSKRERLENLRKWELTGLGKEVIVGMQRVNGCPFTILSYNVLAQKLLTDNLQLYKDCNEEFTDWTYRWPLLQHEVKHLEPDIMTFQEVQASHYHSHFLPWFTYLGYSCIFKQRTGNKIDGCAIIFRADKFNLVEEASVEYNQPKAGPILDRDNIGLIVKLTPKSFESPFCVATTHLLYNPKRQDIKLAQLAVLLTELDRICYKSEEGGRILYCPAILTGDFNTTPYSVIIQLVRHGKVRYEGLCRKTLSRLHSYGTVLGSELLPASLGISDHCQHTLLEQSRYMERVRGCLFSLSDKRKLEEDIIRISHSSRASRVPSLTSVQTNSASLHSGGTGSGTLNHYFKFSSVYQHKLRRLRNAAEVTTKHDCWITVDYIFYTKVYSPSHGTVVEGPLKLLGKYGLLSQGEAESVGQLPSDICPSDHFPLAAQFLLKPV